MVISASICSDKAMNISHTMASVNGDAETQHITADQRCGFIFDQSDIVEPSSMGGTGVADIDVLEMTVVSIVETQVS